MFRKFTIILLLTVLSLRPAYFVGTVVYYETHLEQIIEDYCVNKDKPILQCNGKCHLAKENTLDADDVTHSDIITKISTAFFPVYFQETYSVKIPVIYTEQKKSCFKNEFTYKSLLSNNIHKPPKFS